MKKRRISRTSPLPYYAQLRDIIAGGIDAGRWRPGDLIPSEAELGSTYQVSRTVIRKALDLLGHEGRIRRIKGKGTVVLEPFLWNSSPELSGPYQSLAETYRVLAVVENSLTREEGEQTVHVVVLSERSDRPGVPATLSTFDVAGDACEALARLTRAGGTPRIRVGGPSVPVQLAEQFGLRLAHSPTTLTAVSCGEPEAALLRIPAGASVFCFEWLSLDVTGRAVIAGRSLTGEYPRLRFVVRHAAGS
jgi:GntR family transcriptional regulator